jgi:hypothetical protein
MARAVWKQQSFDLHVPVLQIISFVHESQVVVCNESVQAVGQHFILFVESFGHVTHDDPPLQQEPLAPHQWQFRPLISDEN